MIFTAIIMPEAGFSSQDGRIVVGSRYSHGTKRTKNVTLAHFWSSMEHCWWGFQYERNGVEMRHHIGVDHFIWSSDFPHQESDWPDSKKILERNFSGIPEEEAYKMSAGNVIEFFHL